jgi:hypothetical protein
LVWKSTFFISLSLVLGCQPFENCTEGGLTSATKVSARAPVCSCVLHAPQSHAGTAPFCKTDHRLILQNVATRPMSAAAVSDWVQWARRRMALAGRRSWVNSRHPSGDLCFITAHRTCTPSLFDRHFLITGNVSITGVFVGCGSSHNLGASKRHREYGILIQRLCWHAQLFTLCWGGTLTPALRRAPRMFLFCLNINQYKE